MSWSVESFKSVINSQGGIGKSNRFRVIFPALPMPLDTLGRVSPGNIFERATDVLTSPTFGSANILRTTSDTIALDTLTRSVTVPGKSLKTLTRQTTMIDEDIAQGYGIDEVRIRLLDTNNRVVTRYFNEWQNAIVDPDTYLVGYRDDYSKTIIIIEENESNVPVAITTLIKAYPLTVDVGERNHEDASPTEVNVSIKFVDYDRKVVNGLLSGGISGIVSSVRNGLDPLDTVRSVFDSI